MHERAVDSKSPSVKGRNYSIILPTEEQISTCQNWNAQQKISLGPEAFYSEKMVLKLPWSNTSPNQEYGLDINFASYHNCHCSVEEEEKCLVISTDSFLEDPETGHDLIPVQICSFKMSCVLTSWQVALSAMQQTPVIEGHQVTCTEMKWTTSISPVVIHAMSYLVKQEG